jgi:hypothetical protein
MRILIVLGFSLIIGWMIKKLLAGRARPQDEEPRTVSFDQQHPRALSYYGNDEFRETTDGSTITRERLNISYRFSPL